MWRSGPHRRRLLRKRHNRAHGGNRPKVGFYQYFRHSTGHLWRQANIAAREKFAHAKRLNQCKLFTYNQLLSAGDARGRGLAQGVHFYTGVHPQGNAPMANLHRDTTTQPDELPADLQRLVTVIHALPDAYSRELIPALERVVESTRRRRRILTLVQDALSQLRLDMKYLLFDLEATDANATSITPS